MRTFGAGFAVSLALAASPSAAGAAETRKVVAGEVFDRGGKWRFWFGDGFREAWKTPVELPVLDLQTEAGGLTPLRQIGGFETVGLAMKSGDGRGFTFRKLEKHPERVLPKEWQDSELETVAIDQTAAAHPAATAIIGSLAQSVGILFYGSRLAVMPDDPALGEFRETFGGTVGTFDEYPAPGYKGITEIVSSKGLWEKWREGGPENRVDSRAFLKARLFDLVVGNWDRHQGQWRWARIPGNPLWEPLPEDADQAFTRYGGKALSAASWVMPRFMRYSGEYPKRLEGLTANNYDVTRWLLTDLEWPVFEETARKLATQMTDAVIDQAMHQMPPEWYAIDGAQMTKDLRQRRDGIVAYARKFYLHLADRVDVRGTDRADLATIQHLEDGSLDLTLAPASAEGSSATAYYHRRFSPKETQEIRLYLLGDKDRLVTSGPKRSGIHVRMLDEPDPWKNPTPQADRPWVEPRGYGHWTVPKVEMYWEPNQAFMVGGGFARTAWGFRKYPWANMQSLTVLYSTGYNAVRASYSGLWRLNDASLLASLRLLGSGAENMNFFGFGNDTPDIPEKSLYKTEVDQYSVFPALGYAPSRSFEIHIGAEAKVVQPKGGDSLVEQEQAYGTGDFGEVGVRAGFEYDSRGRAMGMTAQRAITAPGDTGPVGPSVSGVRILAETFFVPKAWDVTDDFGGVEGSVATYLGNQKITFAARVGGRKVWGPYPWFESASIGGSGSVRGYDGGRFRGDASLFGNAELRFWLGHRKKAALPLRWGLTAFVDSGRVWYDDEDSKKWHTGYGGGLVTQLLGTPLALQAAIASGTEGIHVYFKGGYSF